MAKVTQIIKELKDFLEEKSTVETYRNLPSNFSRESVLNFPTTALLGISLMKGGLSAEVYNNLSLNDLPSRTDSAYSQARYKIKPKFYLGWNDCLLKNIYTIDNQLLTSDIIPVKRWKGYYIEAIDGSKLTLPQLAELSSEFGRHKSGTKTMSVYTVMALLLCRCDVLNNYIVQSELLPVTTGEISACKKWIQGLNSEAITLFDRGFASIFMFYLLTKYKKPFVMRLKVGFNKEVKEFMASNSTDSIVAFKARHSESVDYEDFTSDTFEKGDNVTVRLVKIKLPNGEIEILATSFLDAEVMSIIELGDLYAKRWGIETAFDRLKNQLLMMCFTGIKPDAIYQDVYATIFVYNLQQLFVNNAQLIVNEDNNNCKLDYAVNNSTAIGILKPRIFEIFRTKEPNEIIETLINVMSKNKNAIRLNRPYKPRIKRIAKRRNLVTQQNFKKAI